MQDVASSSKIKPDHGHDDVLRTMYDDISRLPARLLKPAYLVGKTPFRACRADPRVSYSVYVPPRQYSAVHEARQKSTSTDENVTADGKNVEFSLPLIVAIHGTRRDASQSRDSLIEFADAHGVAILAPLFPAGLDGPTDLDNYKFLRSKTLKADLVLMQILDEVARIWRGIRCDRVVLFGWSGGAQFAHRFAYFHADRLAGLVVGSPGRPTLLVDEQWPKGTRATNELLDGLSVNLDMLRQVPYILMAVGGDDGLPEGAAELRQILSKVEPSQTSKLENLKPRSEFLQDLHRSWQKNGIKTDLVIVPGVAHDYLQVLPTVIEWLRRCPALNSNKVDEE